ncbi:MAG: T9SS type A sorting domain-containing protein [Bacteroidetes bacterium]|nr:T9SS type A sorting domain-containing protein [Bacteroidota bacterium]
MKTFYTLLIACLLIQTNAFSQVKPWPVMRNSPKLEDIKTHFDSWLESQEEKEPLLDQTENEMDGMRTKFMRWYYLMQTRLDAEGRLPDPATAAREWHEYTLAHPPINNGTRSAGWEPFGTDEVPSDGGGVGRINVVQLDPSNPDIIFIGTAGGGVWKSPDAGATWLPLTDGIPVTSIADIAIDPINTNIIYIATGDGYGYEATWQTDNDFWGGLYSAGVMKSTDGGFTWEPTGLSYLQEEMEIVQRLIIYPDDPDILLAATRNGLFRTSDGGTTWNLVENTHFHDLAINSCDADIMYAVGDQDVYKSTDAGATWSLFENNIGSAGDRMSIETTDADPDLIYLLTGNWSTYFYKSVDGGDNWTSVTSPSSKTYFYGYYDNAFAVSDVNGNLIFAGGLEIASTTNGASSWTKKSNWDSPGSSSYVHADNHAFACHPTDENIIYSGNDGGLFISFDKGGNWTDLSNGLRIAQVYRIGLCAADPTRVISGWQDNGTNLFDGTSWEEVDLSTWDGMEAIIHPTNPDTMYLSHQYGDIYRTYNGGSSWTYVAPTYGGWVTPYVMDPNNSSILYYGALGSVYKTTNAGNSWSAKPAALGNYAFALAVAPSNSDYVYAASLNVLKISTNAGDAWSDITSTLPVGTIGINYIAVNNLDEEKVYVALSGYADGEKVYYSEDAGTSWTNISGTLPNVPVNTIVYENNSPNRVYIGTDFGVFYKDDFISDWVLFQTGLPNVMIHELEINYTSNKIVAATYGRGIWQSDLAEGPVINTIVPATQYCNYESVDVSYTSTITFNPSNIFTAELSDASGSFSSPVVIGTLAGTAATGVITCIIPVDAVEGSLYRIRVNSSDYALTGNDNAFNISIGCKTPTGLTVSELADVSVTLNWNEMYCAESYDIRYREVGGTWLGLTSSTNSKVVSGLTINTEYEWSVQSVCLTSPIEITSGYSADETFNTLQTSVDNIDSELISVFPNPAKDKTVIHYSVLTPGDCSITVFDISGKEVLLVYSGWLSAGDRTIEMDCKSLSAGMYVLKLISGNTEYKTNLVIE